MIRQGLQFCNTYMPTEYNPFVQILSGAIIPFEARVLIMNQLFD
jgi:hypothetical protein